MQQLAVVLKDNKRKLVFGMVGITCFGVQLLLLSFLIHTFAFKGALPEIAASVIAFGLAAILNFFLHAFITWNDRDQRITVSQIKKFMLAIALAWVINTAVFAVVNIFTFAVLATVTGIIVQTVFKWYAFDTRIFIRPAYQSPTFAEPSLSVAEAVVGTEAIVGVGVETL